MATKRKKKTESEIINEVSKLVAEVTLQETEQPKPKKKQLSSYEVDVALATKLGAVVTRAGSHLTVKTFPDGHQELEWDDEALTREVREAIASVEKQ